MAITAETLLYAAIVLGGLSLLLGVCAWVGLYKHTGRDPGSEAVVYYDNDWEIMAVTTSALMFAKPKARLTPALAVNLFLFRLVFFSGCSRPWSYSSPPMRTGTSTPMPARRFTR